MGLRSRGGARDLPSRGHRRRAVVARWRWRARARDAGFQRGCVAVASMFWQLGVGLCESGPGRRAVVLAGVSDARFGRGCPRVLGRVFLRVGCGSTERRVRVSHRQAFAFARDASAVCVRGGAWARFRVSARPARLVLFRALRSSCLASFLARRRASVGRPRRPLSGGSPCAA